MSKLPLVLRELHRSETSLARDLLALADRHRADHEIFFVARDIAGWSQIHVRRLAEVGAAYRAKLNPAPRWEITTVSTLTQRLSTTLGRRPEIGLLLLADLRRVHRKAAGVSLDWELLAQAAQAMKERPLLDLAQDCHPQTLRQMRWANAHLKSTSPQVIASCSTPPCAEPHRLVLGPGVRGRARWMYVEVRIAGGAATGTPWSMRLVVFMDGTWNDPTDDTNVNQLCGRVPDTGRSLNGGGQKKLYIKGVGNGAWNRLRGGAFGLGVDDNIREGYRFVVDHHRPGDDIFLFGYSRGAFTARSLAGMITKCGIVSPGVVDAEELFERYRDRNRPGLREMQEGEDDPKTRTEQDRRILANARLVRIRFIGVFDTVGSLGIPGGLGKIFARNKYQFHDTRLSGYVDVARHAVAIDENRPEFKPTLWTAVPIPVPGHRTSVEQRWFVGAHADVGGRGKRSPGPAPLSVLPREWMADEARAAGLVVHAAPQPLTGDEWRSLYDDAYATWLRTVGRLIPGRRPYLRPVNETERETLSRSMLQRWGDAELKYRPRNPNLRAWIRRELPPEHRSMLAAS